MQKVIERHSSKDPDLRRKLAMTQAALPEGALRTVRCPNCGFYLLDVCGKDHYYVRVKCRKCKFDEVIDTALFRTMGRRRRPAPRPGRRRIPAAGTRNRRE